MRKTLDDYPNLLKEFDFKKKKFLYYYFINEFF